MTIAPLLGLLALVAAFVYRSRIGRVRSGSLSDDMIRQIETDGRIEVDDALDLQHIREEEERFRATDPWDEPEEY